MNSPVESVTSHQDYEDFVFDAYNFLPGHYPRWIYGMGWVVLSSLCGGLGNSLEPVAMLAWLQPLCLIIGIGAFDLSTWKRMLFITASVAVMQGAGVCLGYSSMFGYPHSTTGTVMASFGLGILIWLIYTVLAVLPHYYFQRRYLDNKLTPLVYPVCHTAVSIVLIGNVSSTFTSIGNAVLDIGPLRFVSSLVGLAGVEFIVIWSATTAALTALRHESVRGWPKTMFCVVSVLLFVSTGLLAQDEALYQRNVAAQIRPVLPASCVMGQTAKRNSADWDMIWNTTAARVAAQDVFVLWAEEAVQITDNADETTLIAQAQALALTTGQSYIGLGYLKQADGQSSATNHFTLISPQGQVVWNYRKAHPVPGVEDDVDAGPEDLPTHESPYGKLAGAICFDLDFPNFIRQAGQKRVDILLQPSWTWNAISSRHFEGDAVRAIENGFTLVRCSSDGESGVVTPRGRFTSRVYTGHDPSVQVTFGIPRQARVPTMFTAVGFVFQWILLGPMCFFLFTVVMPEDWVKDNMGMSSKFDGRNSLLGLGRDFAGVDMPSA